MGNYYSKSDELQEAEIVSPNELQITTTLVGNKLKVTERIVPDGLDYLTEGDLGDFAAFSIVPDLFRCGVAGIKLHKSWSTNPPDGCVVWAPTSTPSLTKYVKLHPHVDVLTIESGKWCPFNVHNFEETETNKNKDVVVNDTVKFLHDQYLKSIEETDKKYNEYLMEFNKLNNIE